MFIYYCFSLLECKLHCGDDFCLFHPLNLSPGPRMVPSTQLSPQCLLKERLVYQLVASLMDRNASLTARFLGVELCHVLKKKKRVFKL